jgi:hypothetical protein
VLTVSSAAKVSIVIGQSVISRLSDLKILGDLGPLPRCFGLEGLGNEAL